MQPRSKQIKPSICKGFWSITCLLPQVLHKHNFYQATRPRRFFSSDLEVSVWSAEICLQAEERVWWFLTAFGTNTPQQPVKPQHQVFSKPNDSWKLASAFDLSEMFFKPCRRCCRCWLCPSKVSVVPLGPPGLQPCWLLPVLSCGLWLLVLCRQGSVETFWHRLARYRRGWFWNAVERPLWAKCCNFGHSGVVVSFNKSQ